MAEAWQQQQVAKLCSSAETIQKALSVLRIVSAKTRPGSGFVVKHPNALPAICSHLASEQLNNGEVSLQAAMNAACISKSGFSDALKTVRAALRDEDGGHVAGVTYDTLVNTYLIHPREQVVACMEDTERALSQIDILKEKHGANVVSCAIFYWVCQLMEDPAVQERPLCQKYNLPPKAFKSMITTLETHCELIADQIKSFLLQKHDATGSSTTSRPKRSSPTKKCKIDHPSPTKPRVSASPTKPSAEAVAAFHAAMTGSPTKRSVGHANAESQPPDAGPSTPRRPRLAKSHDVTHPPTQSDALPSPSRSQGQLSQPAVRRRFRPVFLEQQQWCDRDPKVERIWADAESYRDQLTWTPVPTVSAK